MMSRCTVTSLIAGVCLGVVLGAAAPAHGATFIYLNSDPDDYVGLGLQYLDRSTDGIFTVNPYGTNAVEVYFDSDDIAGDFWIAVLSGPSGEPLTPGTYEGARRFGDAGTPGLDVEGNGRGCNQTTGRFVVYEIGFDLRGDVAAFAADFEQHCEGRTRRCAGRSASAVAMPPAPPATLHPATTATPARRTTRATG